MSQSGFEMFSNVAGMVIVIADVIFFYALWNIFCKNKKEKMSMMIGSVLLLLNIGLGFISSLPTSGRLIISAIAILTYSIVRYKKHCEKPVFILTLFYGLRSFSLLVANSVFQYVNNSVFQLLDSSSENYIENMNRNIENWINNSDVKVVDCYDINEIKEYASNIEKNYTKILSTSGVVTVHSLYNYPMVGRKTRKQ